MMSKFSMVAARGAVAAAALFSFSSAAQAELGAAGAVSPDNGFPLFYENPAVSNGVDVQTISPGPNGNPLRLSLCLNNFEIVTGPGAGLGALCFVEADVNGPVAGPAFPLNYPPNLDPATGLPIGDTSFPDESFYWHGDAIVGTTGGGEAHLVLGLEATFTSGNIIDGEQIVFGRTRFRIDNLVEGETYTITTPYHTYTEVAQGPTDVKNINVTEDIGIVEGDFTAALNGRIGPFLVPTGFDPDAPTVFDNLGAPYIANPNILTSVTGSSITNAHGYGAVAAPGLTNFFRVEGLQVGVGSPDQCADPTLGPDPVATDDCVETDQFLIMGRMATNFGVTTQRATYTLNATGAGRVDLLASTVSGQDISVSYSGRTFSLLEDPSGSGAYFSRTAINANIPMPDPAVITITNNTDIPPTVTVVPLVDALTVNVATFDTNGMAADLLNAFGNLALRVNSSDNRGTVTLEAFDDLGRPIDCGGTTIIPDNTLVNCATFAVGKVTVRSSAGGVADQDTIIVGPIVTGP